jgi:predicted small secreted protein
MKHKIILLSFIVILSLVLGACAPQAEEPVEK